MEKITFIHWWGIYRKPWNRITHDWFLKNVVL